MGLRILAHAIGQVVNHFGPALRISGVLALTPTVLAMVVAPFIIGTAPQNPGPYVVFTLLYYLLSALFFSWLAVGWHRYVLLDEAPGRFLPRLSGDRPWAYFGRTIQIGLLTMVVVFVAGMPLGMLAAGIVQAAPGPLGLFYAAGPLFLLNWILTALVLRFSVVLPASAVGKPITLGEAWSKTSPGNGPIFVIALISMLCSVAAGWIGFWLASIALLLGAVWQLATIWVTVILAVSLLTTLYGHYVEGRPLADSGKAARSEMA